MQQGPYHTLGKTSGFPFSPGLDHDLGDTLNMSMFACNWGLTSPALAKEERSCKTQNNITHYESSMQT